MTDRRVIGERERTSSYLILPLALLTLTVSLMPQTSRADGGPEYARQVVYAYGPVGSSFTWELSCHANDPSLRGPVAIADGSNHPFGMTGGIFYFGRRSNTGRLVQVGDHQITFEPRQTLDTNEGSGFTATGNGGGGGGAGTAYVAVAFWGSTATCTAILAGVARPVEYLDGSHAFFVGPEAFTGGVFAQDAGWHASAARVYRTQLKGGPAFATLSIGQFGLGAMNIDGSSTVNECREPLGDACSAKHSAASGLTAAVFGAVETNGGRQGEMIVITLPPNE